MLASSVATINVLAVAMVLAMLAQVEGGIARRAILVGSMAVLAFALFRLAMQTLPAVSIVADALARHMGRFVGWACGRPLAIGPSFGGIDFLVLMTALYVGWLSISAPPRRTRAIWGAAAILAGHCLYLVVLAFSDDLASALPPVVKPEFTDISHRGLWTWGNALHALLPWSLPMLAALAQAAIAAAMFRRGASFQLAADEPDVASTAVEPEPSKALPTSQSRAGRKKKVWDAKTTAANVKRDRQRAAELLANIGPGVAAVVLAAATSLTTSGPDLKGRCILIYEAGATSGAKRAAKTSAPRTYALLPRLIEDLGGTFARSTELSEDDLSQADVLVILSPLNDGPTSRPASQAPKHTFSAKCLERFVRNGGGLLVAAEAPNQPGDVENQLNSVLTPTAIRIQDEIAISLTERWEHNGQSRPHPVTVGLDARGSLLGFRRCASLQVSWPAQPLIRGQWAWGEPAADPVPADATAQYSPGDSLGDLTLAAEQGLDEGRVVVLGDASCLSDDNLPASYAFAARLLAYLGGPAGSPQELWRQLLGLLAMAGLLVLLAWRPAPARIATAAVVLAAALVACRLAADWSGGVAPEGRSDSAHPIAYIDASHQGAFSDDPSHDDGLGHFWRILADNGYLPLLAPDVSRPRLRQASLLISIAPARQFSDMERAAVQEFVNGGGTFLGMVGATEAPASRPLLKGLRLDVQPRPVPPSEVVRETTPIRNAEREDDEGGGVEQLHFATLDQRAGAYFYACWPVEGDGAETLVAWPTTASRIAVRRRQGDGEAVLIGDTAFALNKNLDVPSGLFAENARFWRWLLAGPSGRVEPPSPQPAKPGPAAKTAPQPKSVEPAEGALIEGQPLEPKP